MTERVSTERTIKSQRESVMKEAQEKHEKLKREMQLSKEAKEQKERDRIEL